LLLKAARSRGYLDREASNFFFPAPPFVLDLNAVTCVRLFVLSALLLKAAHSRGYLDA
jgi:hypothetical protein